MIKDGKRLKRWAKKKVKYLGKPYKTEEEKKAWKEAYKESRLKAMRVKAKKRGKYEVLKKKGKIATVASGIEKIGKSFEASSLSDMFESPKRGKRRVKDYDMIGSIGGSSDILGSFGKKKKRKESII